MMQIGLLWYDDGNAELATKISQAVKRYRERLGAEPNVCYVNPQSLLKGEPKVENIVVRTSAKVLQHHLWIGQEQLTPEVISV